MPTVAELTNNIASSATTTRHAATASTSSQSSQSSRVITPPINELSQLTFQETMQSSLDTTQPSILRSTQPSQPIAQEIQDTQDTQYTEYTHCTIEEATSSHQRQRWPQQKKKKHSSPPQSYYQKPTALEHYPDLNSSDSSPNQQSPFPAPVSSPSPSPAPAPASPESPYYPPLIWTSPPPARPRGRLYRTKSGNLASAAEIRRRKETERNADELLDMILEGFGGYGELHNVVTFDMDEVGRWRIVRQEPQEVEKYEDA